MRYNRHSPKTFRAKGSHNLAEIFSDRRAYWLVKHWSVEAIIDDQPINLQLFIDHFGAAEFAEMAGLQYAKVVDVGDDLARYARDQGVTVEEFIENNYLRIFEEFDVADVLANV